MANREPGFAQLFQDAFSNIGEIIRSEFVLAKVEAREEIGKATKAGAAFGAGVVLALYALGLLLLAGVAALILVVPPWLAFLLMAAFVGAISAVMIETGRHRFHAVRLKPEKTIATVKENLQWAKHHTE